MTPDLEVHLYIKHAVGSRMLFDVSGANKPFKLEQTGGGWTLTIHDVDPTTVELLRHNLRELNIFYFEEQAGHAAVKSWLYDKDCPAIEYDDARRCVIRGDTKMDYTNDSV
ncbi:hypothetical protein [Paenibacillus xerothermodurans]|uniref:Uncharacterized protein n=1 Tax=Paenibacillus xerothermodurans TaxID=1977292 RepID=A0A2W1NSW8_PAEXE|nr:hypothetical protein [Paenibacillus xerothermodurans]PZE22605.1 hypothetical protein CBW46_002185 [Paenibacillus xerothermodurans]